MVKIRAMLQYMTAMALHLMTSVTIAGMSATPTTLPTTLPAEWDFSAKPAADALRFDLAAGRLEDVTLDKRGRLVLRGCEGDGAAIDNGSEGSAMTGSWESPVIDLQATALRGSPTIVPDWLVQWTVPVKFKKHESNPIFGPAQTEGKFTWVNGVCVIPFDSGKRYRMFFSGRAGQGIGMAEATTDEPRTWTPHAGNPVLAPRADNWEGNLINQPRVVKVTENHWRMYYTGWGLKGPDIKGTGWAMGLAESFDQGLTWKRVSDDPIMPREPAPSYDDAGVFVPHVIRHGKLWLMWYTAAMQSAAGNQNIHLCLAQSDDGIKWTKWPGNPVLSDDFSDGAKRSVSSRCHVRLDNGVFRMWYTFGKPGYRIYYAESLNGIHWERFRPSAGRATTNDAPNWIIGPSKAPAFDDDIAAYPELDLIHGKWRMWYCGNGFGTVGFASSKFEPTAFITCRVGDTATPDDKWSGFVPISRDLAFTARRYVQVRVDMQRKDADQPSPRFVRFDLRKGP